MAVRMTGMISGMDTETLIKGMVDAQRLKNKKVTDKQTTLTWKQDKWKELNTKLYKLYTDDLAKMRLQGSYQAKKVTSSNDNLVSVTGSTAAPEGNHTISNIKLASGQYVTGAKIDKDKDGNTIKATSNTLLTDLGIGKETLINISGGKLTKTLEVTSGTTIRDLVNTAKEAGLSASFDESQGRLFISSKESGKENSFQITATTSTATAPKNQILESIGYSGLSTDDKKSADNAMATLSSKISTADDIENAKKILAELTEKKIIKDIEKEIDTKISDKIKPQAEEDEKEDIRKEVKLVQVALLQEEARKAGKPAEYIADIAANPDNYLDAELLAKAQETKINESKVRIDAAVTAKVAAEIAAEKAKESNEYTTAIESAKTDGTIANGITFVEGLADTYKNNSAIAHEDANTLLKKIGLDALNADGTKVDPTSTLSTIVPADDSQVTYNGVILTGTSNVITANGLTITLKGATTETINLNVTNNTQETYDMVKNFIKSYNDILKEMNNLYYADSARSYAPLSDEEKESMTDDQIEKWESKIKDSTLRRDSTLGTLIGAMKSSMAAQVKVGEPPKLYSLASYGIQTSTDYTEKGLLHIYGNKDDSVYSGNEDKLMKALEEDPDTVMKVLSGISKNLYDTMSDKMKAIPNVSSALTFYNDKLMVNQQTEYSKRIAILEVKLTEMENKYYKQFAAMETAMAKMQSQSSALAGMLGTSK